jgi:hypothetical protein
MKYTPLHIHAQLLRHPFLSDGIIMYFERQGAFLYPFDGEFMVWWPSCEFDYVIDFLDKCQRENLDTLGCGSSYDNLTDALNEIFNVK